MATTITNIPWNYTDTFDQEIDATEIGIIEDILEDEDLAGVDPVKFIKAAERYLRDKWDERN